VSHFHYLVQSTVPKPAQEFLDRAMIREKAAAGELLVKWMDLDTQTERVFSHQVTSK